MLPHLFELRRRALYIFSCFALLFVLFFYFANEIFHFLIAPLLKVLPSDNFLIATNITSPLLTPIKLAADFSLLATVPFALFHIWRFSAPGLYKKERGFLQLAIGLSLILFVFGVLFCFYLVLPYMLHFFSHALPDNVKYLPDMANTLDFITRMLIIFGLCFQVPLLCFFLVKANLVQIETLKKIRPYMIVAAFTVGMLLTPPDVFSQVMLAIPLCLLYEIGIILALLL